MRTIKEVLTYLIQNSILVRKDNQYVLSEQAYGYLGERAPEPDKPITRTTVSKELEELALAVKEAFPAGVKSGGLYVRSSHNSILHKLKMFRRKFPNYSDEVILKATRRYVSDYERTNYAYMKTAEYFIMKDGTSVLESYIENMDVESPIQQDIKGKAV